MAVFLSVAGARALDNPVWLDCRFRLDDPAAGLALYHQGHIPGAFFAHLDEDLADLSKPGGRHPLPDAKRFHRQLNRWGAGGRPLVVYDDVSGAMAARAWWLARWCGHPEVYILDGGYAAWAALGQAAETASPPPAEGGWEWSSGQMPQADPAAVRRALQDASRALVDARAEARYAGREEPIDQVAGHIPGAINQPFAHSLNGQGFLRSKTELEALWHDLLRETAPEDVIHMCGSGVTACFNLAVLEHLGHSGSRLFVDSWSGWITNPDNPVETPDAG